MKKKREFPINKIRKEREEITTDITEIEKNHDDTMNNYMSTKTQ